MGIRNLDALKQWWMGMNNTDAKHKTKEESIIWTLHKQGLMGVHNLEAVNRYTWTGIHNVDAVNRDKWEPII